MLKNDCGREVRGRVHERYIIIMGRVWPALDLIFHAPACLDAAIDAVAYCDTHAITALETIKITEKDVEEKKKKKKNAS